jgi:hypothetical protein
VSGGKLAWVGQMQASIQTACGVGFGLCNWCGSGVVGLVIPTTGLCRGEVHSHLGIGASDCAKVSRAQGTMGTCVMVAWVGRPEVPLQLGIGWAQGTVETCVSHGGVGR